MLFSKNSLMQALRSGSRLPSRRTGIRNQSRGFFPSFDHLEDRSLPSNFTPGNVAVLLAGNSTNATGSILELLPSTANQTTPVQTLPIDSTSSSALRFSSAGSFGLLNDTSDQTLLAFGGANSNSTSIADITSVTQRGVGTFNSTGPGSYTFQTTFTSTTGSGDQVRAATSTDDTHWYIADKNGMYTNNATAHSNSQNIRDIKAFAGVVYVGSTSIPISTAASPTAATLTALPGNPSDSNLLDFTLVSSGQNGPAYDVMYITTGSNIDKFALIGSTNGVGGTWTSEGVAAYAADGLAAAPDGNGGVYLYVSTGSGGTATNSVTRLDDTSAWNASIISSANLTSSALTLYTTDSSHSIRGVAFVPLAATTLTEQVSNHSVAQNTNVTFTANVSSPNAPGGIISGVVYFIDTPTGTINGAGSVVLNAAPIVNGVATYSTTALALGNHKVLAYYPGTASIADALTTTQVVSVAGSTVPSSFSITSASPNPGTVGVNVNLTATITGTAGNPTGSVEFFDGTTSLGVATLSGTSPDTAVLPVSSLSLGTHSNITAIYYGDATYASVTSAAISETINPGVTVGNVTSSNPATTPGSSVTYSVTVTGNGLMGLPNGSPTGTVTFYKYDYTTGATTAIGSPVTLTGSGNVYSATTPAQTVGVGSVLISAVYNGNTNYASASSASPPLIETGKQAFTPGNLVALDRANQPSNASQIVALLEFTTAGSLVQAVALPDTDSGTQHIFGLSGHASTEGALTLSANESYLTAFGFDLPIGTPSATGTNQAIVGRTVARIDVLGNIDTSTTVEIPTQDAIGNPRGAVTTTGGSYYVVGDGSTTNSGIALATGGTLNDPPTQIGPNNSGGDALEIQGGNLFLSTSTGTSVIDLVGSTYNGAIPTAITTLTPLPGLGGPNGYQLLGSQYSNNPAPYGFVLLNHLTGLALNPDTLFIADQTYGLLKFANTTEINGDPTTGTWVLQGQKLNNNTSIEGLVVNEVNPGASGYSFQIYATAALNNGNPSNQLLSFTDLNPYNGGITGGLFNVIANATNATDTFSGLSTAPLYLTTTSVQSLLNPALQNAPFTITATVTDTNGSITPSGTVSFYSGTTFLGNGTLSGSGTSATAQLIVTTALSVGTHNITASYNGDSSDGLSSSTPVAENILPFSGAITTTANEVTLSSTPTFTFTLTGNANFGVPTGSVQFKIMDTFAGTTFTNLGSPQTLTQIGSSDVTAASITLSNGTLIHAGSYVVIATYTPNMTSQYPALAISDVSSATGTALVETVKQALAPGDLLAVQRGDGTASPGTAAELTFVVEYTPSGTLVQKIGLPNLDSGSTHALLTAGSDSAEGLLSLSANGDYLTLTGYDAPVGASTSSGPYATTIARIDFSGNVDTSTAIAGGSDPYSATSNDGSEFWLASSSGINYVNSLGAISATPIVASTGLTSVNIAGGQLYATASAGDVQTVGTGLPTSAGQTLGELPNLALAYQSDFGTRIPEQFIFFNTNTGTANNPNVAYVADQVNGLLKFVLDGSGNWQYSGQLLLSAGGITGIAGKVINPGASAEVQLYATGAATQGTSANQIASFLDTAPAGFLSGSFTTTVYVGQTGGSPNANMNFAGLSFAPFNLQLNTANPITINDGGTQRSRVTSITVHFTQAVTPAELASVPIPFTLTRTESALTSQGPTTQVISSSATASGADLITLSQAADPDSIVLTFSIINPSSGNQLDNAIEYGSLSDGGWQLTIGGVNGGAGYATPDWHTTGTGPNGTAPFTGLYRLFGDSNGDATITAGGDQASLNATFGTTYDPNNLANGYNLAFDWNGDGTITAGTDQAEFNSRFGTTLS